MINDTFIAKVVQKLGFGASYDNSSMKLSSWAAFSTKLIKCTDWIAKQTPNKISSNEYISSPLKEQACFDSLAEKPLSRRRPYFPIWSIGDALEVSRSGLC